jgi:hypothetical protein
MDMKKGIIITMLLLTIIPTTGITATSDAPTQDGRMSTNITKGYFFCYVEIEGYTYGLHRSLFLPHLLGTNTTFCFIWKNRFYTNSTVSIYRTKGGPLLYQQTDVREFHLIDFLGTYNYLPNPMILQGTVLAIRLYNYWTPPG